MNKGTCYICGQPATSDEHAPAKSFFPNGFRQNLVTVRSCEVHNENTSMDDEYVRIYLCGSIHSNIQAFNLFTSKIVRSLQKSQPLMQLVMRGATQVTTASGPTLALMLDRTRFDKTIKKYSYALFNHRFNKIWNRGLIVATPFLVNNDMSQDELGEFITEIKSEHSSVFGDNPTDGNNPQVFRYEFQQSESEDENDVVLWMKFYEGFEIFVMPIIGSTEATL
ncbi:MAG: hypothetical protein V4543_14800 [Bacteroidota bacterium]